MHREAADDAHHRDRGQTGNGAATRDQADGDTDQGEHDGHPDQQGSLVFVPKLRIAKSFTAPGVRSIAELPRPGRATPAG